MSAGQGDAHPDRNSAWLAAYTLGLVSSVNDADRRLADLLEASDGHHDLLASASRHLQFVEVADPAIRHPSADPPRPGSRSCSTDERP